MFENGLRHGQGEEKNIEGIIFSGNWEKGLKNGVFNVTQPTSNKLFKKADAPLGIENNIAVGS